jgi:hypothetical protein
MIKKFRLKAIAPFAVVAAMLAVLASGCASTPSSAYLDAGAGDLTATGAQFAQNWIIRFDTSAAARTLTTPSAADLINSLQSPGMGEVLVLAVAADGANPVTVQGGAGVTVKTSAMTVAGNATLTIYCVLTDVSSGSQAITVY